MTRQEFAALLDAERGDRNFAGVMYHDRSIFDYEQRELQDLWHYCGPASAFEGDGAVRELELFGQSLIVWNTGGKIRAFANICRHRGAPILAQGQKGCKDRLVCPYHGWSYGPKGDLLAAPSFEFSEAERSGYSLSEFPVLILSGIVFIALHPGGGADTARMHSTCAKLWAYHGLDHSQLAASRVFDVAANWKLVVENFLECYHCLPNHPQLTSVCDHTKISAIDSAASRASYGRLFTQWIGRARKLGTPLTTRQILRPDDAQFAVCYRCAIKSGFDTLSETGAPVSGLMGKFPDYDGGETFGYAGPFLHFSLANDHAVMIRVNPIEPEITQVTVDWLVDRDMDVAADIDIGRLTWLWESTVAQDVDLVANAQRSVKSPAFRAGPYSPLEADLAGFKQWYLHRMRA